MSKRTSTTTSATRWWCWWISHSASASEIVSGAIKDDGVGTLVGITTFGKGRVQTIMPLQDGSAVAITTAKYLTPNGTDIHKKGIDPDVRVEAPDRLRPERPQDRPAAHEGSRCAQGQDGPAAAERAGQDSMKTAKAESRRRRRLSEAKQPIWQGKNSPPAVTSLPKKAPAKAKPAQKDKATPKK